MGVRRVAVINNLKNEWISEIVSDSYIYIFRILYYNKEVEIFLDFRIFFYWNMSLLWQRLYRKWKAWKQAEMVVTTLLLNVQNKRKKEKECR